jgi:hypothetical protein
MMLVGLIRRLERPDLSEPERNRIQHEIQRLKKALNVD